MRTDFYLVIVIVDDDATNLRATRVLTAPHRPCPFPLTTFHGKEDFLLLETFVDHEPPTRKPHTRCVSHFCCCCCCCPSWQNSRRSGKIKFTKVFSSLSTILMYPFHETPLFNGKDAISPSIYMTIVRCKWKRLMIPLYRDPDVASGAQFDRNITSSIPRDISLFFFNTSAINLPHSLRLLSSFFFSSFSSLLCSKISFFLPGRLTKKCVRRDNN